MPCGDAKIFRELL